MVLSAGHSDQERTCAAHDEVAAAFSAEEQHSADRGSAVRMFMMMSLFFMDRDSLHGIANLRHVSLQQILLNLRTDPAHEQKTFRSESMLSSLMRFRFAPSGFQQGSI